MHSYVSNKMGFSKGKDMDYTLRTSIYIEVVGLPILKARNLKNAQKCCISHIFLSWALNTEL